MRRWAVLATAAALNFRFAKVSLRRNFVVGILTYLKYVPVPALRPPCLKAARYGFFASFVFVAIELACRVARPARG
jgi:hypothetical protein